MPRPLHAQPARPRRQERQARRLGADRHGPRARQNSTQSRTSGSIYGKTGSRTASSRTMTPSSTPPATLGEGSRPNPRQSPQSACATGPTSVRRHSLWYQTHLASWALAAAGSEWRKGRVSARRYRAKPATARPVATGRDRHGGIAAHDGGSAAPVAKMAQPKILKKRLQGG